MKHTKITAAVIAGIAFVSLTQPGGTSADAGGDEFGGRTEGRQSRRGDERGVQKADN